MHYFQPLTFTLSNLTSLTATMKYLALALLLCSLPSLSDAACYRKAVKLELGKPQTHCQDDVDKTWHPVGSTWRNSECMDCDCTECCSAYSTPRQFPDDCVSVFDSVACAYIVHKKDDPSVQCPIYAAVGK
ncbi:beta-microseminoprotein-like [Scomber japonicus]|uniref:beta-microseminoprotein-like n=1 Tax=Scomber japonicus TaxID=13676 RepID=UPI002306696E|nr:beta-microseminoprotein-like [Scomber japonicus]